jgi:homoserine O-acetyltransferase
MHDPDFRDGWYYDEGDGPDTGLALARMLAHITYLSPESMQEKFDATRHQPRDIQTSFEKRFSVGSYLAHQGSKFVGRFDANSYIRLSMAMDLFDLGQTPRELRSAFDPSQCAWLVVSFTSDWLFAPEQSRQIVAALLNTDAPVSYCNIESNCGHDAFLLPNDFDKYGPLVEGFLAQLTGEPVSEARQDPIADMHASGRLLHAGRQDYRRILDLIPPDASVLDLGCGNGGLLADLNARAPATRLGVEVKSDRVIECVRRGLYAVHADMNEGLPLFDDDQFDVVVLSLALQAVWEVERVLEEMVRVGRRGIVSFPNFGFAPLVKMLAEQGRAPVSAGILSYEWYDTPNLRFFTIKDFEELCERKGFTIHEWVALNTETGQRVTEEPNRNADLAVFVLSR